MANENDDVLNANQGAPAADIPDLKKKDKERKRAGAAWSGARGAAGEFSGATGGTVSRAAASAASAAAEGAVAGVEAGGGLLSGVARFLAGLTSTLAGKIAVAAAAFMMMAGAGLVGYALLKGDAGGALGVPNLGGISNSMKVRAGGNDRMGVASNGELRFDPLKPAAPAQDKKPEAPKEEAKTEATDLKDHVDADAAKSLAGQDKLAHTLSGAKLSSSLGGEFGGKNIFAGNGNTPKFNDAMAKVSLPKMGAQKGKLGAMQAKSPKATASTRHIAKGKTSRAIGQLRLAKGMSMLGAQAGSAEGASSAAQGAFDQTQTQGGALNAPEAPGDGTVTPNSVGAPDTTMPAAPDTPSGYGVDPGLQNALGQIGAMADQARQMQQTGEMLLAIGIVIMAIGFRCLSIPVYGWIIGGILIALGGMLIGMGYMMMQMASMMANMAKSMGSALAAQTGNTQQGQIINECTDQALAGTQVSNCHPSEETVQGQRFDSEGSQGAERVRHIGDDQPTLQQ